MQQRTRPSRMWMVDPELLCRQHLLGEHFDIHRIVGSLRRFGTRYMRTELSQGHIELQRLRARHDDIVKEMLARGYKHDSPLPVHNPVMAGYVDVEMSRVELRDTCEKCLKRGV